MEDKIYFKYNQFTGVLSAKYKNKHAEIGLSCVPEIFKSDKTLLFEEEITLGENYLKEILNYKTLNNI